MWSDTVAHGNQLKSTLQVALAFSLVANSHGLFARRSSGRRNTLNVKRRDNNESERNRPTTSQHPSLTTERRLGTRTAQTVFLSMCVVVVTHGVGS